MFRRVVPLVFFVMMGLLGLVAPAQAAVSSTPVTGRFPSFDAPVFTIVHRGNVLYVGGQFTHVTADDGTVYRRLGAVAINASTGSVLPWNPRVRGTVRAILPVGDRVVIGGDFTAVKGKPRNNLVMVKRAGLGKVDKLFGFQADGAVLTLAAGGSKIYLGGAFDRLGGRARGHLAAIALGKQYRLTSWTPQAQDGGVSSIAVRRSGVYVAGGFEFLNGNHRFRKLALVRASDGRLVTSFDPPITRRVIDMVVTKQRVYTAIGGPGGGHAVASDRRSGATVWARFVDGDAQAVTVLGDAVYFGGHFSRACATHDSHGPAGCADALEVRKRGAAYSRSGTLLDWNPDANSAWGVHALQALPGLKELAMGGEFTTINGGASAMPYFAVFGTP